MMAVNGAVATATSLVLLQLSICYHATQSQSLCHGEICSISPDNFWKLQDIIDSNRVILLNGSEFYINNSNGPIIIESVTNLTISGGERGSLVHCSPESSFGFYLNNAINVSLTNITIRKCGAFNSNISLAISDSRGINISNVHIEYSPGSAVGVTDSSTNYRPEDPFFASDNVDPHLVMADCNISHNRGLAMYIYGATSLLIERTVIANSPDGIGSNGADIMMRNVSVIKSKLYLNSGRAMVRERLTMNGSDFTIIYDQELHINSSKSVFYNGDWLGWNCYIFVAENSEVVFTRSAPYLAGCILTLATSSTLNFTENIEPTVFSSTNASLSGTVIVANNTVNKGDTFGPLTIKRSKVWLNGSLEMVGNRGKTGGISVLNSDIAITGSASFVENVGEYGGALYLSSSVLYLSPNSTVDFTRNQAKELGGAIYVFEPRTAYMCDGFIKRIVSCSIHVVQNTELCQLFSITFNQNKAGVAGNAIYGDRTSACSPNLEEVISEIFYCLACPIPDPSDIYQYNGVNDSSDLSNFTSDPTRVCLCENDTPDCYQIQKNISVHPGEYFTLSLAVVGYGMGTVPGSVIARGSGNETGDEIFGNVLEKRQEIRESRCQDVRYSIVTKEEGNMRELIALAVNTLSFTTPQQQVESIIRYQQTRNLSYLNSRSFLSDSIFETFSDGRAPAEKFFHIPVFVEVDLLPCPVGFQLKGKCMCHQILLDNNIDSCSFSNGKPLILRPAPYWIGLPKDTSLPILIHPYCPFDYCQSEDINITADSPDTQCQYQRSGVLCGSCHEGLSMILGSSECKTCSNLYLLSITVFIVMGVALVTMVTLLNMTVSVGTLNGLILFANILQANQITFLPPTTSHASDLIGFLSAFIAWLNLDLGVPICFFNGLTTYVKTWIQFVFPLYILALVGVIIIASKYSTRVTRLFGTNTVSILATLVLLSYTKILRILITAFSFTKVTGSHGYHRVVWLADGNVKYFEPKHAILFLVSLLVLLLLGVPYTVTLTAAPWIQRSKLKWVSSLYNKFKPLFDAYMGPYKDSHRYWTGMLLLARVVLSVLFSSIANTNTVAGPQLNLLLLILSSSTLLVLTAALKPYKTRLLNGLEIFHLTILLIFASSNLYISSIGAGIKTRAAIYIVVVGICFLVFLGICAGHIWYRVWKARSGRRLEPPRGREEDEEEWYPLWREGVRIQPEDEEDEEGEDVTISTAGATNTSSYRWKRESLLELIANAD